jgi:hypothetical protein
MKPHILVSATTLLGASLFAVPANLRAQKAEFSGIQFIARSYGQGNDAIRPFQAFDDGVKLAFIVNQPAGGIIGFELDESVVETFADDKGTKLFASGGFKNGFGSFPRVSADGKAGIFTLEGTVAPAAGATKVIAKGKVLMKAATKKETVKAGAVAKSAKLTCKALTIEVKGMEKAGSDSRISLTCSENMDSIVEANWLDASGKKLESEGAGSGSFGFGGKKTYTRDYSVKGTPATVEFVMWSDMKITEVPFEAGITLATAAAKAPPK